MSSREIDSAAIQDPPAGAPVPDSIHAKALQVALGVNHDLDLMLMSKSQLKKAGNPQRIRADIRANMMSIAVRLRIALDVMDNPTLYGRDIKVLYEQRCREVFGQ